MKTNIIISVVLCFLMITGAKARQADIVDDLAGFLKSSNSREVSKHFASTVEMIILNEEGVYSKVQAEIILKDFLSKHDHVRQRLSTAWIQIPVTSLQ